MAWNFLEFQQLAHQKLNEVTIFSFKASILDSVFHSDFNFSYCCSISMVVRCTPSTFLIFYALNDEVLSIVTRCSKLSCFPFSQYLLFQVSNLLYDYLKTLSSFKCLVLKSSLSMCINTQRSLSLEQIHFVLLELCEHLQFYHICFTSFAPVLLPTIHSSTFTGHWTSSAYLSAIFCHAST